MNHRFLRYWLFVLLFIAFGMEAVDAQVKLPRLSQDSRVTQTIGVTDVSIRYSRPGVKGRVIWGGLVPFDSLWRTGANEATVISFADTISINGSRVPPGSYSIVTIPGRELWTVIFNKDTSLFAGSSYTKENDALRISVKPELMSEHHEWMRFSFEDLKENSGRVMFVWEKLSLSFTIETPTHELVMRSARRTISWSPSSSAANYLLERKIDLDLAMKWIDLSLSIQENYWNMRVKAQLLAEVGKKKEAIRQLESAISLGEKMENKPFDFSQMKAKLAEWKK